MPEAVVHAPEVFWWLLFGAGATGFWFLVRHALRDYLAEDFATKKDLDGVGARVTAITDLHTRVLDRVDKNEARLDKLEAAHEFSWQPLIDEFKSFREAQVERDRRLEGMLGTLEGTLREFIRGHDRQGGH